MRGFFKVSRSYFTRAKEKDKNGGDCSYLSSEDELLLFWPRFQWLNLVSSQCQAQLFKTKVMNQELNFILALTIFKSKQNNEFGYIDII